MECPSARKDTARPCCYGVKTLQLDARGHDLLLKNLSANCFLAGFWATAYKLWRGGNETVWNIPRGFCSYFAFSRRQTSPFLPSRLPPSRVFTEQPQRLALVQLSLPFPSAVPGAGCSASCSLASGEGEDGSVRCTQHWCYLRSCISTGCTSLPAAS